MRFLSVFFLIYLLGCSHVAPPTAVHPIPTKNQIGWQEMEFYGFIHFGLNTFIETEWGYGDANPEVFNPVDLNAEQWVLTAKKAEMKGLIITAKHHDGFCLWPSAYTEYSVKNSPWKNGQGDVVKELANACKRHGLKMGIYLSPWDRNRADYGKPEYIAYYRNQLTELLTNYGPVFEVWFDGANGGDGYYGGANETRHVAKKTYYDWKNTNAIIRKLQLESTPHCCMQDAHTNAIIRKLQPDAIIWSDAGPDARWVGNEHGFAYETTWSPLLRDSVYGGMPEYSKKYSMGQENGTDWVPAEADVSIRPGWFYHTSEDDKVKSLEQLLDIYYNSVGQNANLLLNLPVNKQGLIPKQDSIRLMEFSNQLKEDFKNNLAYKKQVVASNVRGNSKKYDASNTLDGDNDTYWATDDEITQASLIIELGQPTEFNRFVVQEYIPLGQRVKAFSVAIEKDGKWQQIASHTTIGYKRILRLPTTIAGKIKFTVEDTKVCLLISNIEIYNAE